MIPPRTHLGIVRDPYEITVGKKRDPGDPPLPGPGGGIPPPSVTNAVGSVPDLSQRLATGPDAPAKVYGQLPVEGRLIAFNNEYWYQRALVAICAGPIESATWLMSPDF